MSVQRYFLCFILIAVLAVFGHNTHDYVIAALALFLVVGDSIIDAIKEIDL